MGYQVNPQTGKVEWTQDANPLLTNLPSLITGASALLGGISAGAANTANRAQTQYEREQQARQAQMNWLQSQMMDRTNRAMGLADRMPLGAEQSFVGRQGLLGGAAGALGRQPMPSLYGGVVNPFAGMDLTPYGTGATATALAERRKALAGIDPNFQFGAMGSYGLQGPEVTSAEQQVSAYARDVASQRMAQEQAMTNMLNAQYRAATGQAEPGTAGAAPAKKGGFWSKLGKIAAVAAPIALAPFTGGASLATSLIGAGTGAASGALGGGGLKGALLGGAMGAIPMGGKAASTGLSTAAKLQKAILNPMALTKIAGAAVGGPVGTTMQAVAPFLPGANYGPDRTANTAGPFGPAGVNVPPAIPRGQLVGTSEEIAAEQQAQAIGEQFAPAFGARPVVSGGQALPAGSSGNPFLDASQVTEAIKPPTARAAAVSRGSKARPKVVKTQPSPAPVAAAVAAPTPSTPSGAVPAYTGTAGIQAMQPNQVMPTPAAALARASSIWNAKQAAEDAAGVTALRQESAQNQARLARIDITPLERAALERRNETLRQLINTKVATLSYPGQPKWWER